MKKIMILEDDRTIVEELKEILQNSGYQVCLLKDFENIEQQIEETIPDLILLDINLPYQNGNYILQNLRKKSNVPIIMVTSKNSEADEVLSMSYGADDYITKPYNPNILLLRIGAVLKRFEKGSEVKTYKGIEVNMQKGILKKAEEEIILTKNEMIIFNYLLNHQKEIVTRDELMTTLWNNEEYINDNALSVNISRLRAKLKSIGCENAIDTRKKIGYLLK